VYDCDESCHTCECVMLHIQRVAVCCSVLQRTVLCCSVLQCVAECCNELQCRVMCEVVMSHATHVNALCDALKEWVMSQI